MKLLGSSCRHRLSLLAVVFSLATLGSPASAADPALSLEAKVEVHTLGPADETKLEVTVIVPEGWHLWAFNPGAGPKPLSIRLDDPELSLEGGWFGPGPVSIYDRGFSKELLQYGSGKLVFERRLRVRKGAAVGSRMVPITLLGQICTDGSCLDQRIEKTFSLDVEPEALGVKAGPMTGGALEEIAGYGSPAAAAPRGRATANASAQPSTAGGAPPMGEGLWSFLLIAFLAGLGALATPCVFPAIPLTVSFFSKFSEENFGRGRDSPPSTRSRWSWPSPSSGC